MKEIAVDHIKISYIQPNNDRITVDTSNGTIVIQSNSTKGKTVARISGAYDGGEKPKFHIHTIRGTHENPESLRPGDFGMSMGFTTYFEKDGEDIAKSLAAFIPQVDFDADINHPAPASNLNLLVNAGDGSGEYENDYRVWRFLSDGSLKSKIFQCSEQNNVLINNIKPKNGMIIYNSNTHKFQGYANGIWVDLH